MTNFVTALPKALLMFTLAVAGAAQADEAEKALATELVDCAAYYQISSDAVAGMAASAPQMAAVGEKLKQSGKDSLALAAKYFGAGDLDAALKAAKDKQMASLGGSGGLGTLMEKYKESCKSLLANPGARLEYWQMATMQ